MHGCDLRSHPSRCCYRQGPRRSCQPSLALPLPACLHRGAAGGVTACLPGVGKGLDWTLSPSLARAELRRTDMTVQAGGRRSSWRGDSPVILGKVTWRCPCTQK